MPSVQKAHDLLREKDVAVLAISIDGTGERAVKPFMAEHGYTFPSLIDQTMAVARQFGVRLVPTTYVVNREGMIGAWAWGRWISPAQSLRNTWKRCGRHRNACLGLGRGRPAPGPSGTRLLGIP
jgi:peroxiredoxin